MRFPATRFGRLAFVVSGVLLLLAGVGSFSQRSDRDPGTADREERGSVLASYEYREGTASTGYDIAPIDDVTSAVYLVDRVRDVRAEVWRGIHADARRVLESGGAVIGYDIVTTGPSTAAVHIVDYKDESIRGEVFRGADAEAYAWVESGSMELVFGQGPREDAPRAGTPDGSLEGLENDSLAFVPAVVGVLMIVVGSTAGRRRDAETVKAGRRFDRRLGIAGVVLAVAGPTVAIWEASHPGDTVGMLFLATLLSSSMVAVFVAVAVRHHEARRRGAGSVLVILGVVLAVGFTLFALLQGLDPMLQDPERFEVMDLVPSDTTPLAILFAVPLALASAGLLTDLRSPRSGREGPHPGRARGPGEPVRP